MGGREKVFVVVEIRGLDRLNETMGKVIGGVLWVSD